MSQLYVTGVAKIRNLTGALTASSGIVDAIGIGTANGLATLDGSAKLTISQLPNSVMELKGDWDASTNTPTLANGVGNIGDMYRCSVPGTVDFGAGGIYFYIGDLVLYTGSIWQKNSASINLTTIGNSGPSSFIANVLNVPYYTIGGLGGVPNSRLLSINGTQYDLSADRAWNIPSNPQARNEFNFTATAGQTTFVTAGYVVNQVDVYYNGSKLIPSDFTATNGINVVLGFSCVVNDTVTVLAYVNNLAIGGGGTSGALTKWVGSSTLGNAVAGTDYQVPGNYITALTGDITASGPGSVAATLATVNTNTGTFGSSTAIPVVTVNGKGLITAMSTTAVSIPSGALSFIGDVTGTGTTGSNTTLTLATVNTNVYASNTFLKFSVNGKGLVTSAAAVAGSDITGALGYTPEDVANKATSTSLGTSNTLYPTQNAVKTYVDSATAGGIILQGDWNASTNSPNISSTTVTGWAWRVSVAGTTNIGGITDWQIGDLVVKTATGWMKIDNTDGVTSVFGRYGAIVASEGDYSLTQLSDVTLTTPSTNQVLKYNGTGWINSSDNGLTSVGVSMPSAFTVTGSPLTSNGTISITGAGSTTQYIDGSGALQTFPTLLSSDTLVKLVRNQSGATMTAGTVIYISGATGNKPLISKALATSDSTSAQTYGLVQADIANNADGYVVVIGNAINLDTSALTEGQQLYLSGTTAGAYITTKPYAPIHLVYVGIVLRSHPTQGIIGVKIQNGYEMDELHNVDAQSPSNNDILSYNTTTNLWEHKQIATTLGYTPISLASLSATSPIFYNNTTGVISSQAATASVNGYLTSTDWNTFNGKQAALGYTPVPTTRQLTINGTAYDLSADRSWTINSMVYPSAGIAVSTGTAWGTSITDNSTNWNTAYTNRITSLTVTGSSGAATLVSNVLNIPTYTLSGLGGQPLATNLTSLAGLTYASASFVKMTASGTFALDTNTYLTTSSASSTYQPLITLTTTGSSGASTFTSNTLNVPNYTLAGLGGVPTTTTLTINGTAYDLSANRAWTVDTSIATSRVVQKFTATAAQTTFTITGGYTVGMVDVYYNGVKLDNAADFTASNGTTVVLTTGALLNSVIEVYKYGGQFIANNALRVVTPFTATAGQTSFTVTYSVGLVDVYYNGAKLAATEYTATTGTAIVLATAAQLNDIIEVIAYNYTVGAYSGIAGSGTATQVAYFTSSSAISSSSNLYWDNTNTRLGIGINVPTATLEVVGGSGGSDWLRLTRTGVSQWAFNSNSTGLSFINNTSAVTALTLASTGAATFSSSANRSILFDSTNANGVYVTWQKSGADEFYIGRSNGVGGGAGFYDIYANAAGGGLRFFVSGNASSSLTLAATTGAATFSSSVTAGTGGYLISGDNGIKLNSISGTQSQQIQYQNNGTTKWQLYLDASNNSFNIYNSSQSANNFTIASTGAATFSSNVGIGTIGPNYGGWGLATSILSATSSAIELATSRTTVGTTIGGVDYIQTSNTTNKEVAQISALNVGSTAGNTGADLVFLTKPNAGSITERMRITSGGTLQVSTRGDATEATANLILGNINYGAYHWLDGTAYYIGQNSAFRSLRMYSGASSAVGVSLGNGSTSWGTYSDERLKENIENIDSVLPRLSTLRTVKYHLKNVDTEDSQKRYGLIAQDLVGKFDEVLNLSKYSDEDKTEYYDVRYTELIPVLVKAIQEQQAQIEELKAIVATK